MHVLHVFNGLTGGAAESTLEIINELNANDIESSIYVFGRKSSVIPNKIEAAVGGRVFRGPSYLWVSHRGGIFSKVASEIFYLAYSLFLIRSSGSIKKVAKSVNASLISSCTSVSPDGALAALRAGIPHVWHIRELYGEGKMFSAKMLWRRNFRKSILSTGMVVTSTGKQRGQAASTTRPVCGTGREALQGGQLTGNQRFVDEVEPIIGVRIERRFPGRPPLRPV